MHRFYVEEIHSPLVQRTVQNAGEKVSSQEPQVHIACADCTTALAPHLTSDRILDSPRLYALFLGPPTVLFNSTYYWLLALIVNMATRPENSA